MHIAHIGLDRFGPNQLNPATQLEDLLLFSSLFFSPTMISQGSAKNNKDFFDVGLKPMHIHKDYNEFIKTGFSTKKHLLLSLICGLYLCYPNREPCKMDHSFMRC